MIYYIELLGWLLLCTLEIKTPASLWYSFKVTVSGIYKAPYNNMFRWRKQRTFM